jgi:hypothetical protein
MYIMLCVKEYSIGNVCKLMREEQNLLECRFLLIASSFYTRVYTVILTFNESPPSLPHQEKESSAVLSFFNAASKYIPGHSQATT